MAIVGGRAAWQHVLLAWGLQRSAPTIGALLLNLEAVFTVLTITCTGIPSSTMRTSTIRRSWARTPTLTGTRSTSTRPTSTTGTRTDARSCPRAPRLVARVEALLPQA